MPSTSRKTSGWNADFATTDDVQPSPMLAHAYVRSADVDAHAACLTNWQQQYDQLSAGRFRGEFEEFRFGSVQLFCEVMNRSIHQNGLAWPGSLTVAVPVSMDGLGWFNGTDYTSHSMLLVHNDCEFDFRTPPRIDLRACTVDAEKLADYARRIEHRELEEELSGHVLMPTTPEKIRGFGHLLVATMSELRDRPELAWYSSAWAEIEETLYRAIISACIPAAVAGKLQGAARPTANMRRQIAMRARDYMLAHIGESLTIGQICTELDVPRRTLQYSFEDVFGLSPVRVLRALRLNGVRRSLRELSADSATTIGDIAAQWGFWHLSHFAATYKNLFGELPSQTLKHRH